jgi:uncharacterized protein (TIGR02271 family)
MPRRRRHPDDELGRATEVIRAEEELRVDTVQHEVGRVRARKVVETEHVEEVVPRYTERAEVERADVEPGDSGQVETLPDGSIPIPVFEEQLIVEKRLVVVERVILRKYQVSEDQHVEAELRRPPFVSPGRPGLTRATRPHAARRTMPRHTTATRNHPFHKGSSMTNPSEPRESISGEPIPATPPIPPPPAPPTAAPVSSPAQDTEAPVAQQGAAGKAKTAALVAGAAALANKVRQEAPKKVQEIRQKRAAGRCVILTEQDGRLIAVGPYPDEQAARQDSIKVTGAPSVIELMTQQTYFAPQQGESTTNP